MLPYSGTRKSNERPQLTGYAHDLSRRSGEPVVFCLDAASKMDVPVPVKTLNGETVGEVEVEPYRGSSTHPADPWRRGFQLPERAVFDLDSSLPSGVYLFGGRIPFVHRRSAVTSEAIAVLLPSHTGAAFNRAGGRSLYETSNSSAADVVSFHRPLSPALLMNGCIPFVKWFYEGNPYLDETTYLIDSDLEDPGALDGIEVLLVLGRSEYWTRAARECFDAFVNRGGRALLLCSEIMHWQVRVDLEHHQLICPKYHDKHPNPLLRCTFWHDPSLEYPIYPRTGCELWHGGSSATDDGIGWEGMRIICPSSPFLDGAGLEAEDVVSLPHVTAWDGAPTCGGDDGAIQVDFGDSAPWRYEVIGYNHVKPAVRDELQPGQSATSLWIALRHMPRSGTVVHGGCMAWCGEQVVGDTAPQRIRNRQLVLNMLRVLREDAWPFAADNGFRAQSDVSTAST